MPHEISVRTYVLVCALLILLTLLTVGASFMPMQGVWHTPVGLAIALCKASLVVLFFMHAIVSNRVTWSVIAVACFWIGILMVLTFADYVTRDLVPRMPGH